MRLAFLLPNFGGGGAEPTIVRLANEFARRGYHVDMVVFESKGPNRNAVSELVRVIDLQTKRAIFTPLPLRAYLRAIKPEILITALFHVNIIALATLFLLRRSKPKIIITERAALSAHVRNSPRKAIRWLFPLLARHLYPTADGIVGVSKGVADDLKSFARLPDSRVCYIYNPTYRPELLKLQEEPAKEEWVNGTSGPLIISVARLEPSKDHKTLLRAFRKLQSTTPARLLLVGQGSLRAHLEALVLQLGLQEHVRFAGYVDNPLPLMKAADLFVLASKCEGFPNVLIEALSCGLPIVSSDCPAGPAEILNGGAFGTLVPIGDADAMAEAMRFAITSPNNKDRQRRRAQSFSLERSADAFERLMIEINA